MRCICVPSIRRSTTCSPIRAAPRDRRRAPRRDDLGAGRPHDGRQAHARGRARCRREHPLDHPAGEQQVRDAVRPRGHLLPRHRPRRRHGHDGRGRRPDPALRGRALPGRDAPPGRDHPALRRAHRRGDAAAGVDEDLDEYWIEINRLENTGDKSYRRILAKLFSGEYKAIEVLKLKDIVESLEGAIDAFEKVANIVEQIAVKES